VGVKPKTKGVEEELAFLFYQQQPPDLASGQIFITEYPAF
jgi:hypothetical protein